MATAQKEPTKPPETEATETSETTEKPETKVREADYDILVGAGPDGPFWRVTTVHLERSAGQKEARKRFVQSKDGADVRAKIENGEEVFIAAIPARSWQPKQVRIEQPPPRLEV